MPKHEPKIQVLFVLQNWLMLPYILVIGFTVNIYPRLLLFCALSEFSSFTIRFFKVLLKLPF